MKSKLVITDPLTRPLKRWLSMLLVAAAISGRAGPGDVGPNFDPGAGFGFTSYGMGVVALGKTAVQPDGKVLISSGYSALRSVFGQPRNRLARLNVDGSLDLGFQQGMGGLDGNVSAFAIQPDGKILIGGNFTKVNGVSRPYLARLNADGSLDPTFLTGLSGPDYEVAALSLQTDGQIVVAGYFTNLNGTLRSRLGRLNVDGSVDLNFLAVSFGQYNSVRDVVIQADGKVLAAGTIATVNGVARGNLARFNPDGSLDTTFLAGMPGANSDVSQVIVQPDGRVLIAGYFSSVNGFQQTWIARLEWDGSTDTNFVVNLEGYIFHSGIRIGLQADGKVVMGANFHNTDRTWRNCLGRLNPDGSIDRGFPQIETRENYDLGVNSLSILADGRIVIAGGFNYRSDTAAGRYLCRVNPDGTLDRTFECQKGVDNPVLVAQAEPDGKVLLAGKFMSIAGSPREGFARLNSNGSLDLGMTNPIVSTFGQLVRCIVRQADGKIILGGDFQHTNGVLQRGLMRLNSDGSLDASYTAGLSDPYGHVWAMAMTAEGKLLVGGQFREVNGYAATNLVRLHADGTVDNTFIRGTIGIPQVITIQSDGKILLGGNPYGGAALTRLNPDGSLDSGFLGSASDVRSIAVQPDGGKILIAGGFTTVNGAPKSYVARLSSNGGLDTPFAPLVTGNYPAVNSVALQPDGKVIIGGEFWAVNGVGRTNLARLHPDGSLDTTFLNGPFGPDGVVNSVSFQDDGKILIGGEFVMVNGVGRGFVARVESGFDPRPAITVQPQNQSVPPGASVSFQIQATGAVPLFYQWYFDLTNRLDDATNSQLQLPTVDFSEAGAYTVVVSNSYGSVTSSIATLQVVILPPAITVQPVDQFAVFGAAVQFSVEANGTLPLSYQWLKGGLELQNDARTSGSQTTNLTLASVSGSDAGGYSVIVSNEAGSVTSLVATLTVEDPRIINHPATGLSIRVWDTATLHVGAAGSEPLHYQWRKSGTALLGQTSATLVLPNAQTVDSGNYDVVVTNSYGSLTSAVAVLTVSPPAPGNLDLTFHSAACGGGPVQTIAIQPDGRILIGGKFTTVGGGPWRCLARLENDGSLDASFHRSIFTDQPGGFFGVASIASETPTQILIGGSFQAIDGMPRNCLARLNYNGVLDSTTFHLFDGLTGVSQASVFALTVQPDGKILAGGFVVSSAGARPFLVRLNADGSRDPAFLTSLDAPVGQLKSVHSLAVQTDGKILLGGFFTSVNGVARTNLARLNPDGSLDDTFVTTLSGFGLNQEVPVSCFALQPDNKILIGGNFTSVNGTNRPHLARLNPDGLLDSAFLNGLAGPQGTVLSLTVQTNGKVLVGGRFNSMNGTPCTSIARLQADGSTDTSFTATLSVLPDVYVDSFALPPDGGIIIGGWFSKVNGTARSCVARLVGDYTLPNVLASPKSQTMELGGNLRLVASANGLGRLGYLWFFNVTNLLSAGTNCNLDLTGVQFADSGMYTVVITNAAGAVTSAPVYLNVIPPVDRRMVPGVSLSSDIGGIFRLDYTDALVPSPTWLPLAIVPVEDPLQRYFDVTVPFPTERYYRAAQIDGTGAELSLSLHMIPALTLAGSPGDTVRVDGINAIGPTDAWFPLATVTLTDTTQLYFDITAPGQPLRLYRLVPLP